MEGCPDELCQATSLTTLLVNSFQRASSVARPLPGDENRISGRASHHEECGDGTRSRHPPPAAIPTLAAQQTRQHKTDGDSDDAPRIPNEKIHGVLPAM